VIVPKKHSRTGFTTTLAESFGRETVFRWQGSFLYSSWFHWITPGCFVLLLLSGLSMFNPMLLSGLFGGGQSTIHPWIGTVLLLSYAGMVVQFWRDNMWDRDDIAWMRAVDRRWQHPILIAPSPASNQQSQFPHHDALSGWASTVK
jgi:hypothetical protein